MPSHIVSVRRYGPVLDDVLTNLPRSLIHKPSHYLSKVIVVAVEMEFQITFLPPEGVVPWNY